MQGVDDRVQHAELTHDVGVAVSRGEHQCGESSQEPLGIVAVAFAALDEHSGDRDPLGEGEGEGVVGVVDLDHDEHLARGGE